MSGFSRRSFVKGIGAGVGASAVFGSPTVSAGVEPTPSFEPSRKGQPLKFQNGVASGDPLQDRLIIWTRVVDTRNTWFTRRFGIPVVFQVATDSEFENIVRGGFTRAKQNRDYTVKVDLVGLNPNTTYFYRFLTWCSTSPVGTGKTLPVGDVEQVKLAVMSCSNYPAGYFNVYQDASLIPDVDAVCHLGDYIYEYGPGGYATEVADEIGRGFEPGNDLELLRLRDYRARYAQYRSDEGLQNLHASAPFICVWDDHEVANDAWKEGAENHNEGEGSFERRKRAAIRAYYEWMPIRPPGRAFASEVIYRRFDFGQLLSLHMLDTRIIGRDEQLNYANYFGANGFDAVQFTADVTNPERTILGEEQLGWLLNGLTTSTSTWQVLGQQVLMGRMNVPVELLANLANPSPDIFAALEELATIKGRILAGDPTVTDEERLRVETVAPYNLDAWDGYFVERETIFGAAAQANKNLVCLAGDTHNAWANNLTTLNDIPVGVEFATSSVTSPGLEEFLGYPAELAPAAEGAIGLLIDGLQFLNLFDRGYMTVTFTPDEAVADWVFVDNILDPSYNQIPQRARSLKVRPGATGRQLEEVAGL